MAAMAVKEESLHHATENLILQSPRKYYRASIDTSHWQLRSLISCPEQDIVYFPNGTDILSINTRTRERELVVSLTFLPRCLVASKDWLCCGGDNGNYSAICLREQSIGSELSSFLDAGLDSRLPLELDPTRRSSQGYTSRLRDSWRPSRLSAESTKVGTEIVNCITLWSPRDDATARVYKVPVAVVSNNDRTVSILDVATSDVMDKMTLPDFVNRATISPDGELLVAVCDDPFLYIFKRREKRVQRERFDAKPDPIYVWARAGRIQLESQRQADRSQMRGSFALSFSNSGKYLAVATQYGVISVFDTDHQLELMVSFTTSRPSLQCGAVRAMEFTPGPYDLLAWTESSGRVGVADVRELFVSRQLILINSDEENVERVLLSDRSGQGLGLRNIRNEPSTTPDYLGLNIERRREEDQQLRSLTREMIDRHQTPLTVEEELEVLHAHRVQRRQRDAAANAARDATSEASGTSRWGPWAESRRSGGAGRESSATARLLATTGLSSGSGEGVGTGRLMSAPGLPTALREFVNPERSGAASFRAFIDERNRENARRSQLSQDSPRRRVPLLIVERDTSSNNDNDATSRLEGLSLTPGRRASLGTQSARAPESNTPWAEVESVYRSRLDTPIDRSTRLRVEVADDEQNVNPRDFAHRLRQPWRPSMDDAATFVLGSGSRDENGLLDSVLRAAETMGCCWSPDGRILYVATLEGIHEYHVNIPARKKFPSIKLR